MKNNRPSEGRTIKCLSALLMILSLTFLTCVNFFLYPTGDDVALTTSSEEDAGDNLPGTAPNPTEEKSGNSGFSILEEMIHEVDLNLDLSWFNKLYLHKVMESSKIALVHFELLSPPPEV